LFSGIKRLLFFDRRGWCDCWRGSFLRSLRSRSARLVEEHATDDTGADIAQQVFEHFRSLAFVLNERIALGVGFQPDGYPQGIHAGQVFHPQLRDHAQQNMAVDLILYPPTEQILELELTESIFVEDKGIAVLNKLKEMEIQIAIDDFGTAYSSFNRLREMAIDCLKIDRSFLCGLGGEDRVRDEGIVRAIIAMGRSMDLRVIAEGVETSKQADFLKENHCQEAQGFLFSKPVPAQQIKKIFESH
ncbi:MAG TPA: EAL domain-containing protein, partial [Aminobacteriaceae bacterium]|nr:EAL domain-containing protein [Aminobacteriaceae bacterium]